MRDRLDRAIANGEEPIVELWSQAMEYIEQARRLVVKAGGDARIYKVVATELFRDIGAPVEENIAEQFKAEYRAAAISRNEWFWFTRRTQDDMVLTPFGRCVIYASDTCSAGAIEWLA